MPRITSFNLKRRTGRRLGSLALFVTDRVEVLLPDNHIPAPMVELLKEARAVFDASTGPDTNPLEPRQQHALYALCVAVARAPGAGGSAATEAGGFAEGGKDG